MIGNKLASISSSVRGLLILSTLAFIIVSAVLSHGQANAIADNYDPEICLTNNLDDPQP